MAAGLQAASDRLKRAMRRIVVRAFVSLDGMFEGDRGLRKLTVNFRPTTESSFAARTISGVLGV